MDIINNLSLLATISVLLANIFIVNRMRLAISLFIVCNICYVIMMMWTKSYILAGQNAMLICINVINLLKTKTKEMK